jgi:hypothetical protein
MPIATLLISFVLFVALFGNFSFYGLPDYLSVVTEISIILLFLHALVARRSHLSPPVLCFGLFFLTVALCSAAINRNTFVEFLASIRLILRFFFFYIGITLLSPDEKTFRRVNNCLAFFILCQLPAAGIKFFFYGISEETHGLYTRSGSVSTMLPIGVIFYLAGFYFFYYPHFRYVLLSFLFIVFSIIGKKRAVAFLYPLQFVAIYYFFYAKTTLTLAFNKAIAFIAVCLTIVLVFAAILYLNDSLNPSGEVGGIVDFHYAFDYAKKYDTAKAGDSGYTTGRLSSSSRILQRLWEEGFPRNFFGFGPGSFTTSILDPTTQDAATKLVVDLNVYYGLTSFNRIALEYGFLGALIFTLMLFYFIRISRIYYRLESDRYWKAFAAGSVGFCISMFFFYFMYSHGAFWGDTMPAIYFYSMAVVYTRLQSIRCSSNETSMCLGS